MEEKPESDNQVKIEGQTESPGGQTPDQDNPWLRPISRREALRRGAILVGSSAAVIVGGSASGKIIADILVPPNQEPAQPNQNPEQTKSPEVLSSDIEFGFNTHVHASPKGETDNMTPDAFKGDVDKLVEAKQEWIRFNFMNEGVIEQGPDNSANFSDKVAVFDEAIDYAKQKGLKIALVTNVPEFGAGLSVDQYAELAKNFYSQLADKYKGKIDTWQIFNEADTHHFKDYHDISQGPEPTYLEDLAKVVAASASAIKSQDQNAKITMNASLWAPNRDIIRSRTEKFFDAVQGSLDFISLDPYPDVYDPNSAATIPQDIEYFHDRYGKDIVIAEIGVSARDIPDPQRRSSILLDQISAIKGGKVLPKSVFIYEMRDEENLKNSDNPREGYFGTQDILTQLTQQMQPPQQSSVNNSIA